MGVALRCVFAKLFKVLCLLWIQESFPKAKIHFRKKIPSSPVNCSQESEVGKKNNFPKLKEVFLTLFCISGIKFMTWPDEKLS